MLRSALRKSVHYISAFNDTWKRRATYPRWQNHAAKCKHSALLYECAANILTPDSILRDWSPCSHEHSWHKNQRVKGLSDSLTIWEETLGHFELLIRNGQKFKGLQCWVIRTSFDFWWPQMTFDLHEKQFGSSNHKGLPTVHTKFEVQATDIVCTRFSYFDLWWPQITFDLHGK